MEDSKIRELITEAAAILVQEGGADHLSLSRVAGAAHLTEDEVRRYFPTTAELVVAMATGMARTFYRTVAEARGDDETPGAWLRAYVLTSFALDETGDMSRLARALLSSAAYRPHFVAAFREREEEVEELLYDDGIGVDTAIIVRAAMDGIFFGRIFDLNLLTDGHRDVVRARLLEMIENGTGR